MSHIEVSRGRVTVVLTDETDAWDLAHAFPYSDGFHRDMADAIIKAWPEEESR